MTVVRRSLRPADEEQFGDIDRWQSHANAALVQPSNLVFSTANHWFWGSAENRSLAG